MKDNKNTGFYNHPFIISRERVTTKTALGLLSLMNDRQDEDDYCTIKIKIIKTLTVFNSLVEGPIHSSTLEINVLNKLIDVIMSKAGMDVYTTKESCHNIPSLVNWMDVKDKQYGGGNYRVYIIYSKIVDGQPWLISSIYNKYTNAGFRIGFYAVIPSHCAIFLYKCIFNKNNLIFEIDG